MRITIVFLAAGTMALAACSTSVDSSEGVRSDGLAVECVGEGDYQRCTPEDGDDECENWDEGGTALMLWPPNHKLVQLTLDDCAPVDDDGDECEEPDDDGGEDDGTEDDGAGDDGTEDDGTEDDGTGDDGTGDGDDGSDDGGDVTVVDRVVPGPTGAAPVEITAITSDEDVEVGPGGDGNTADYDMALIDGITFELRAERQGGGDGRVYRIHYLDENGEEGACEFMVPHDRGPHGGAVDSGTVVTLEP